jgi:hypothetical protein
VCVIHIGQTSCNIRNKSWDLVLRLCEYVRHRVLKKTDKKNHAKINTDIGEREKDKYYTKFEKHTICIFQPVM